MSRSLPGSPPADLGVRTYPGTGNYELVLATGSWPNSLRNAERVRMAFEPGTAVFGRPAIFQLRTPQGVRHVIQFSGLPANFLQTFGAASTVTLRNNASNIVAYQLPRASGVATVLASCERLKLIDWGADPAGFGPGAQRPRPAGDQRSWVDVRLIPALLSATQTDVVVSLVVGGDGRVARCSVLEANLDAQSKVQLCSQLTHNARYQPARGPTGTAVRSVVVYRLSRAIRAEIIGGS
jgi:hypothetical protein